MRRVVPYLLVLALVACGQEVSPTTTVATTTTEAAPEALALSYKFEPGTVLDYEVTFDQHLTMTSSGEGSALGEEDMPGNADLQISGATTFSHTVEEGAEPGTFDITIVGDFTDLAVTGTVDGEPVDPGDIPDLAEVEPIETTITVDEQGNVISGGEDDFGMAPGLGGGLSGIGGMAAPGLGLGSLVGPQLPDGAVTVGDEWSETIEEPDPFGEGSIATTVESRVTGTDTLDGAEVFVIESDSSTSLIEIDLAEMMIGFFSAFMPEEATAEETEELAAMLEDLRFLMAVDPSSFHTTSWFDPAAGYARRSETDGTTRMTFDVNFPDDATGEMAAFTMEMTMDQSVTYRLLGTGSA